MTNTMTNERLTEIAEIKNRIEKRNGLTDPTILFDLGLLLNAIRHLQDELEKYQRREDAHCKQMDDLTHKEKVRG